MLKFYDDPTMNESEIVIFLRQVWCAAGKKRILGKRRGKTKLKGWTVVKATVWPNISLFIPRILITYYFIYFYYFIKTNSILFVIKYINKIPFYFLSNYYLNTLISLYLFNYKNLIIKLYLFTNNNSFQISLWKMGCYKLHKIIWLNKHKEVHVSKRFTFVLITELKTYQLRVWKHFWLKTRSSKTSKNELKTQYMKQKW